MIIVLPSGKIWYAFVPFYARAVLTQQMNRKEEKRERGRRGREEREGEGRWRMA